MGVGGRAPAGGFRFVDRKESALHLGFDARDLGEADLVHLVGGEIERRVPAHALRVVVGAAGQIARGDRIARRRQVLVDEEAMEHAVSGRHLLEDRQPRFAPRAAAVRLGDLRQRGERRPEHAVLGTRDVVDGHRFLEALEHDARLHHAARNPCAQVGDLLLD